MPGLLAHISRSHQSILVLHHSSACDFLSATYSTLRSQERSSNIILAHALKRMSTECVMTDCLSISESNIQEWWAQQNDFEQDAGYMLSSPPASSTFWLTVWSSGSANAPPTLDLVLSCVDWTLGDYPIFLWSPRSPSSLSDAWLVPRITQLVDRLHSCNPPERVFSVFGKSALVKSFAKYWTNLTGFRIEREPFYSAWFTFCTLATFKDSAATLPEGYRLRRAVMSDIGDVAQLCKEFADDSIYFPLELQRALMEAKELISKNQIWVYDAGGAISTICAVTRVSHNVSAITKVYTTPAWRKKGCAEHLVRYVTYYLLTDCHKESVVLYVGHENNAQKVYDRVGFVGLCGKSRPDGVEDSLELGFVGAERGHW